jgi:hypothetical protein
MVANKTLSELSAAYMFINIGHIRAIKYAKLILITIIIKQLAVITVFQ